MKKLHTYSLIVMLSFFSSNGQSNLQKTILQKTIERSEDSKSGNYKDILYSFFQLASTNLTGPDKTIEINTTLFALKLKANPELGNGNYLDNRFSRNFQFNFKANLDTDFKYKGFTGGVTYTLVNSRDKHLAVLTKTIYGVEFDNFRTIIEELQPEINDEIVKTVSNDSLSNIETAMLTEALEDITNAVAYDDDKKSNNKYYQIVFDKFNTKAKALKYKKNDINDFATYLKSLEKDEMEKINAKPLWTLSTDGTAGENGKFTKASIGTVFLNGIKGTYSEIDVRAKFIYADTLTTGHLPRTGLNAKAGINFKLSSKGSQVSYFEIKALGEYNKIYNNVLPNEKSETISANAEIRIRITKDLWLPLAVKYDLEKANFLGFLNVTYNFDQ